MKIIMSFLSLFVALNFALANSSPDEVTKTSQDIANMLENGAADIDPNVLDEIGKSLRFIKFQLQEEGLVVVNPIEPELPKNNLFCGTSNRLVNKDTNVILSDFSNLEDCLKAIEQSRTGYYCGPSNKLMQVDEPKLLQDFSNTASCENAIHQLSTGVGYYCGNSNRFIEASTNVIITDFSNIQDCAKAFSNAPTGYICGTSNKLIDLSTKSVLQDYSNPANCQRAIDLLSN